MTRLDIEQPGPLTAWLRAGRWIGEREQPEIRVLAGGVSNRTVLVRRPGGEAWVLKQALERLRVPVEWISSPERAHREALGMRWLVTLAPAGAVPPLVFEDAKEHVIAMRAVPEPHANWKSVLLAGEVGAEPVRQFGQLLGTIHRQARLAERTLRPVFEDRSFFENLRLEPFYEYTAHQVPAAAPFLRELAADTRRPGATLVHGDYSPKNILLHRGHLILLDHEVVHWGDPMFDVGFAAAHLLSKAHALRRHREALAGATILFWEHYRFATCDCLASARDQARAVRHTLGCLLARAAGRSQVEYLDAGAKQRQVQTATRLAADPPATITALADHFLTELVRLESAAYVEDHPPRSPGNPG